MTVGMRRTAISTLSGEKGSFCTHRNISWQAHHFCLDPGPELGPSVLPGFTYTGARISPGIWEERMYCPHDGTEHISVQLLTKPLRPSDLLNSKTFPTNLLQFKWITLECEAETR
jgi:hypothetical protein